MKSNRLGKCALIPALLFTFALGALDVLSAQTILGGTGNTASSVYSTAWGYYTNATGVSGIWGPTTFGYETTATNSWATAFGALTMAGGNCSTAFGVQNTAVQDNSTVFGIWSTAGGYLSTAFGYNTSAMGYAGTSFGVAGQAAGYASTAWGMGGATASGSGATAFGYASRAGGNCATATGTCVNADSVDEFAVGAFTVGGGDPVNWVGTDPLFEIGNGYYVSETGWQQRQDALVVYKNGNTTITGTLSVSGSTNVILVNGGGDLSMGSFTSGTAP